jgi:hypothetical protein
VAGCGALVDGCRGRLRLAFDLQPQSAGHALYARVHLHATNQITCLWGEASAFDLQAGVPRRLEMILDNAGRCATPVTMAFMDVVVEGTVEVASRQEWGLRYEFVP